MSALLGSQEKMMCLPQNTRPRPRHSPLSLCMLGISPPEMTAPGGLIIQDGVLGTWGRKTQRTCFLHPQSPLPSLGRVRDFQLIETIPGREDTGLQGLASSSSVLLEFGPRLSLQQWRQPGGEHWTKESRRPLFTSASILLQVRDSSNTSQQQLSLSNHSAHQEDFLN